MRVLVLGGGIVGVTTAYTLIRDGHEVTLVDRQPDVALECSYANGGYIAVSQAVPWSAPGVPSKTLKGLLAAGAPILLHPGQLPRMWRWGWEFLRSSRAGPSWENTRHVLRLAQYSLAALKEVRVEAGIRYDALAKGSLKVYRDRKTLDEGAATSETQAPLGLTYRVLGPQECVAMVPALAPRLEALAGGIHYPDEENGDCHAFARGVAEWCRAQGATFVFGTTIRALERDGDRIARVVTDRGAMTADAIVVALGADTPLLLAGLGIRVSILPVKGYSLTFPRSVWPEAPDIPVLDEKAKFGYAPLGEGRLRMTGFAEIAGYDTVPEPRRTASFVAAFAGLFPQLHERLAGVEVKPFCCLRPVTPDGPPILGRSGRFRNLFYNAGQGHLGWTLAHGSARIVAAAVAGRDAEIDTAGYGARPGQ